MKCNISDGGKEDKEPDISTGGSRFPRTPVYNSYMVGFFLGGETLSELLAQHYVRITAKRVLCYNSPNTAVSRGNTAPAPLLNSPKTISSRVFQGWNILIQNLEEKLP